MDWSNALGTHDLKIHVSDPKDRVCYYCKKMKPEAVVWGHEWVAIADKEFGHNLWTKYREQRIKVCKG